MKTILLIIRHFFPRRRWVEMERHELTRRSDDSFYGWRVVQKDQFGNLRTFKITP